MNEVGIAVLGGAVGGAALGAAGVATLWLLCWFSERKMPPCPKCGFELECRACEFRGH
jgi:hypothetical protein